MGTPELVNPVPVDEARDWVAALATTFLGDVHDDDFPRRVERWRRGWDPDRVWGYRDRGRWVATLHTHTRTLTVPAWCGGTNELTVDALTAVTVAGTHRRRGLLTAMLERSLQSAKDRGDPLSMLVAAEWPIYGRFGYAPAVFGANYTYWPRRPLATLPAPPAGSLRSADAAELGDIAPAVFDTARRRHPGQVDRPRWWWDRELGLDGYEPIGKRPTWIVHDGPDGPDGLLAWRATRDFDLDRSGAIEVVHFAAATDAAYRDLWAYLGGIDIIDEVKLTDRPVDEPVRWLLRDGRAVQLTDAFDYVWLRLLDVPAALAARGYAVPGRVVLEVVDDDLGGYGAGRYVLDVADGTAHCAVTDRPAELRVSQRALAACYLGGVRLRGLPEGVQELASGALARADLMFSVPVAPVNQTGF